MLNLKSLSVVCSLFLITSLPAAESEKIRLTALNSMQRIGQNDKPIGPRRVEIAAARNETESFQIIVTAPTETLYVSHAALSALVGPGGAKIGPDHLTLYREEYVRVRRPTSRAELPPGLYPDPLVPFINPQTGRPIEPFTRTRQRWGEPATDKGYDMYALPFDLFKGQNQPLWIDVHVPHNTPAGEYRGTFQVKARGGISGEIPVSLTVWNFTLPNGPTHRNHFGHLNNITHFFNVKYGSEKFNEIELRYCQTLARHRLNPPLPRRFLPEVNPNGSLKINSERHRSLKKFIADLHVTDFQIPRAPFARLPHSTLRPDYNTIAPPEREKALRYYRTYYEYLKQNGWEKRAYLYLWDEPNLKENYQQVLTLGRLVHEAAPDLKCLVVEQTYLQNPAWPDPDSAIDIWCPLWAHIDRDSILAKITNGDEVWSYTALTQRAPRYHPQYDQVKNFDPPYWHIDRSLAVYRVPTWINWQYHITGLLYWSIVTRVIDPWNLPAFAHPRHYNGGGYLLYPGVPCGIDGPAPSIRLKNLRDGMEDYEYFVLLAQRAGRPATTKIVNQIAPNWWNFSKDPAAYLTARQHLAQLILQHQ